MKVRNRLIQAELAMRIDAGITLAPEEEANRRLMALKHEEIERTREYFPPAHSFLKSKTRQLIDQSPILEIMRRMPKGGVLHAHGCVAMGDRYWLIKNATYLPNCYIYQGEEEPPRKGTLRICEEPPEGEWFLISDLRKAADDVEEFDEKLYQSVTLGEEDLELPDIWAEFRKCFARSFGMFRNEEIRYGFCQKMLRDLIEENVQYIEARGGLGSQKIIEEIQRDHPEFKVKYIYSATRSLSQEKMAESLDKAIDERVAEPDIVIGFDLMEEEDKTHTDLYFIHELLEA
ncbi:MAG: hypothetical protein ACE5L7_08900, partial [Candidatus Aminicenantales bacterium]